MKRLAVLISNAGKGSNLQAIIDAIKSKQLNAETVLVISDAEDANGLKRAEKVGIPTLVYNSTLERQNVHGEQGQEGEQEQDLEEILRKKNVDLVCLAGWKQIIPDSIIANFQVLNVHPGLIPDTLASVVKNPDGTNGLWNKGMFTNVAIQDFLHKKATYAGCSVHFLSMEFDFGPVLKRGFVKVEPGDTIDSLYFRLKKEENRIYVESLKELCNE